MERHAETAAATLYGDEPPYVHYGRVNNLLWFRPETEKDLAAGHQVHITVSFK